jgi:hypothetical protein
MPRKSSADRGLCERLGMRGSDGAAIICPLGAAGGMAGGPRPIAPMPHATSRCQQAALQRWNRKCLIAITIMYARQFANETGVSTVACIRAAVLNSTEDCIPMRVPGRRTRRATPTAHGGAGGRRDCTHWICISAGAHPPAGRGPPRTSLPGEPHRAHYGRDERIGQPRAAARGCARAFT